MNDYTFLCLARFCSSLLSTVFNSSGVARPYILQKTERIKVTLMWIGQMLIILIVERCYTIFPGVHNVCVISFIYRRCYVSGVCEREEGDY